MTMSGWIKIGVEFIKELAGQWKGSSDPDAPSETVDTMAEEEPVADSVVVRPESHQINITSEASPNKQEIERRRDQSSLSRCSAWRNRIRGSLARNSMFRRV